MARQSADRRMDRIIDRLLPPGSMERREYDLPDEMRAMLQSHRQKTNVIIARAKLRGAGEAYRLMIEGELTFPPMPAILRDALGLAEPLAGIGADASVEELASAWDRYREGENQ